MVVITGASSGIGAAAALAFARRGARLELGARRLEKLNAVAEKCRKAGSPDVNVRLLYRSHATIKGNLVDKWNGEYPPFRAAGNRWSREPLGSTTHVLLGLHPL